MIHPLHLYGTLGPSCTSETILKKMFLSGMNGMRLNLSHAGLQQSHDWLAMYSRTAERMHIAPELLVDLQGPELRIGSLDFPLDLILDDVVFLVSEHALKHTNPKETILSRIMSAEEDLSMIPCPDILFSHFQQGQELKLDDGKITLKVSASLGEDIVCAKVIHGGKLDSRKSIAIEGISLPLPVLTSEDRENLKLFRKYGVTGVMLPFVRNADDLITLRKELGMLGMDYIRIFAKIESLEGFENLPSLLPYCDEIVIARGDLGNSLPLSKVPALQKKISMTCLRAKKPFMVVTQLLASMEENPVPTRAEVMDIFQAVLDGASSLMLTGETAIGHYPSQAMQVLSDTCQEALQFKRSIR